MEKTFKVGDRVILICNFDKLNKGSVGTVLDVSSHLSIRFDNKFNGHDCNGRCENGYGYYVSKDKLEIIQDKEY